MRNVIFLAMVSILLFTGCKTAQLTPAEQAQKDAEQQAWFELAVKALNERTFVLEADRIDFKYGRSTYVNANTNFISVHDDDAMIQLAFNSPYAGPNGIGGITVEGMASSIKMQTNKKGDIEFSMMVQGVNVSASVDIYLYKGSNQCTATVSPYFSGNRISFSGKLFSEEYSNVFKGRSI